MINMGGSAKVVKKAEAPASRKGSFRLNSENEITHILMNSFPVSFGINTWVDFLWRFTGQK